MVKQHSKILLTGSDGFVGKHLLRVLTEQGHEIYRLQSDLRDYGAIEREVLNLDFEVVVHLAGVSQVPYSEKHVPEAYQVNVLGLVYLLEVLRKKQKGYHFVFAGSAQIYDIPRGGNVDLVITEDAPVKPRNVYGQTKRQGELLLADFAKMTGSTVALLRFFNHTHKSQAADAFLPSMYQQISAAKDGGIIEVGDMDVFRDFGTIDDLVRALVKVVNLRLPPGESELINICSGQARNLRSLVGLLSERMGKQDIKFVVVPERLRAGEPKRVVGSYAKATRLLGWHPLQLSDSEFIDVFLS
jgi:nucleoside-diphosphate-sugar epimerase